MFYFKKEQQNSQHLILANKPFNRTELTLTNRLIQGTMSGQAGRSLAGSQETAATDAIGDIEEPIVEAIQVIEAFLGSSSMSLRVKDAWKRVRNAAERPANIKEEVIRQGKVLEQVTRDVQKTL